MYHRQNLHLFTQVYGSADTLETLVAVQGY